MEVGARPHPERPKSLHTQRDNNAHGRDAHQGLYLVGMPTQQAQPAFICLWCAPHADDGNVHGYKSNQIKSNQAMCMEHRQPVELGGSMRRMNA